MSAADIYHQFVSGIQQTGRDRAESDRRNRQGRHAVRRWRPDDIRVRIVVGDPNAAVQRGDRQMRRIKRIDGDQGS